MTDIKKVAIIGGNRIPFARSNGVYADASNIDMLSSALSGLVERFHLADKDIGEVVAGTVLKHARDLNLTREAVLNTCLKATTPTYDISQACGTGLQAIFAVANKIALGHIEVGIAGGTDTTSDAPIALGDGLRKPLLRLNNAKSAKDKLLALSAINPKKLLSFPQNAEPRTHLSMGEHQALTAHDWGIERTEQDRLALMSHRNLEHAYREGFFDDLMTPYKGLSRDDNLRVDTTLSKLGELKPVFGKRGDNPTMTAGNSSALTDGASCVLLSSEDWAQQHGYTPLAYLTHQQTVAVDFLNKDGMRFDDHLGLFAPTPNAINGLLMAPVYAVPKLLKKAGLTLQDFDFYEIHEAFASQVLVTLSAWENDIFCHKYLGLDKALGKIDRDKLNVNGGSLATGHPFAATGGRIIATTAKLLAQRGSGRALISICCASGQGVACILER